MTTLFYADPELVIAHGRKVLFLNPHDLQVFKEIELPADLTTCGLKLSDSSEDQAAAKSTEPQTPPELCIQNVSYSPDRQLVVLTTTGQKALLLFKSRPEHAQLISVRPLARASSALAFAHDSASVLVTDKTGDCYQFDCTKLEEPPRLLLGHLSIVYDIVWTPDQQHIITCDRDDKIRVTKYPETHDINSYCLGHKEFVSGLALLAQDQALVSVSGDKTLRVWDYLNGKELLRHELPAPAVRLQCLSKEEGRQFQLAVLFYDHSEALGVYNLQLNGESKEWEISESTFIEAAAGTWSISNFTVAGQRVYVSGSKDEHLILRAFNLSDGKEATDLPAHWLEMVHEQFQEQLCPPEDWSVWFKKRFDNISDYMERKKRRIEERQQK